MITGEIRSKIDRVWNAFWSGGISNPLEVIEQITYLMFIRRLDEKHRLAVKQQKHGGGSLKPVFPEGSDEKGRPYTDYQWSTFQHMPPDEMYQVVSEHVFPFLRQLRSGDESTYAHHMRDARFTIPTAGLLSQVVQLLCMIDDEYDENGFAAHDTKGDLYEYMLGKIATAGHNGQFRTPRHIAKLMVELVAPQPSDVICDPAAGTCGFLMSAAEYVRRGNPHLLLDKGARDHFHHGMFHGFDFDSTMLRIGSMNMLLHDVENPNVRYRDSLSKNLSDEDDAGTYSLILANPPFAGSLDESSVAYELKRDVKTKKTELLFLALFLRLLQTGGRAAVIVPDGVLFGSTKAHKQLRKTLVEEHKLDAVVKLPSGVFKPYAGVSTAILLFTKTGIGGTDHVWFYDVTADGLSLDDKRTQLVDDDKFGPVPAAPLTEEEHAKNNLPDVVDRWKQRTITERERPRTAQSFCIPKSEIADQDYDLSLNRYQEIEYEEVEHRSPAEILDALELLEKEIHDGMIELRGML
ncbi:class I SAM-dependent DNA methyltransferase [Saccharopolyspora shandongensis]|uniref:type I restriction-modification system subunit M n=1 Tax=Saccharopolyspora shandongensis TaxID=418495 RepID=UPI0033C7D0AC